MKYCFDLIGFCTYSTGNTTYKVAYVVPSKNRALNILMTIIVSA